VLFSSFDAELPFGPKVSGCATLLLAREPASGAVFKKMAPATAPSTISTTAKVESIVFFDAVRWNLRGMPNERC
jgi:hypothetical protein